MPERPVEQFREKLDAIYRAESGRILATLIRLLGDFDLAEDAMHGAFAAALERWARDGVLKMRFNFKTRQESGCRYFSHSTGPTTKARAKTAETRR